MATLLATGHFKAQVIRETAYGVTDRYGELDNTVRLYDFGEGHGRGKYHSYGVEWDAGDRDGVTIGVLTRGRKKVFDYDGVFSMPLEIGRFLQSQGFDLSELYSSQPELRPHTPAEESNLRGE